MDRNLARAHVLHHVVVAVGFDFVLIVVSVRRKATILQAEVGKRFKKNMVESPVVIVVRLRPILRAQLGLEGREKPSEETRPTYFGGPLQKVKLSWVLASRHDNQTMRGFLPREQLF